MSYHRQEITLSTSNQNDEISLLKGRNGLPENIVMAYYCNANIDSETLDITGNLPGDSEYMTANVHTQITMAANANVWLNLSSEAKGFATLKFTAATLAATETVKIVVITW